MLGSKSAPSIDSTTEKVQRSFPFDLHPSRLWSGLAPLTWAPPAGLYRPL